MRLPTGLNFKRFNESIENISTPDRYIDKLQYRKLLKDEPISANQVSRILGHIRTENVKVPRKKLAKVFYYKDMIRIMGKLIRQSRVQKLKSFGPRVKSTVKMCGPNYVVDPLFNDSYWGKSQSLFVKKEILKDKLQHQQFIKDLTTEGIEPNPGPQRSQNKYRKRNKNKKRRGPRANFNIMNLNENNVSNLRIMPAEYRDTLTYNDNSTVRNAPGNNYLVWSMRINDLFDPDPLVLSGSVSNFKEIMQFYSYYRVEKSACVWTVVNLETFPLSCGVVFSQTNLVGTISSLGDAQNAFENDFVIPLRTISGKGGMDRTTFFVKWLDIGHLLGVRGQYKNDLAYSGQGLASPSIPLWANFIVLAPTGAALANGYANNTRLHFNSEFFGRTNNRS